MKKLLAILLALGLLVSSGTITSLSADSEDDVYVSWGELLPPQH